MGMDCYGENPKLISEKPVQPDFSTISEDDKQAYFDALAKFEEDNPGVYFRNNVWWWRPLWNYVCETCSDVLSVEDMQAGQYNDGYLIDAEQSEKIAELLGHELLSGRTATYEEEYRRASDTFAPDDMRSKYPFTEDNVIEFQAFVQNSGGFRIC